MDELERYLCGWYGELGPEVCMAPDHYRECLALFESQPASPGAIILLGDSLTEFADWSYLLQGSTASPGPAGNRTVLNRGIAGDMIEGMILRLDELVRHNPSSIFLMAGCNNFVKHPSITVEQVWEAYRQLISRIGELMPHAILHIASTLPLNPISGDYYQGINSKIAELNALLQQNSGFSVNAQNAESKSKVQYPSQTKHITGNSFSQYYSYYDMVPELSDANGFLRQDLTIDGCHLNTAGYRIWTHRLASMIEQSDCQ